MIWLGLMVIYFLAPSLDGFILKQVGSIIAIKARQGMFNKGGSMHTTSTTTPTRLRWEDGRIPLAQETAARERAAAERQAEGNQDPRGAIGGATRGGISPSAEMSLRGSEPSWSSALVSRASSWLERNSAGENQVDWDVVTKELEKDFMASADEESTNAGGELLRMALDPDVRTLIQHIFDNREIIVETLREGRKPRCLYSFLGNNLSTLCKIMKKYSNSREFRTLLEWTWKIHNPEENAKNWITETLDITLFDCFSRLCDYQS